ncbi:hypothetical protein ACNKHR_25580 [Shigella flexneri]
MSVSPVNNHPFCLFNPQEDAQILKKIMAFLAVISARSSAPWQPKHLHEFGGDIAEFRVVKVRPSNSATNCYRQNGTRR